MRRRKEMRRMKGPAICFGHTGGDRQLGNQDSVSVPTKASELASWSGVLAGKGSSAGVETVDCKVASRIVPCLLKVKADLCARAFVHATVHTIKNSAGLFSFSSILVLVQ